MRTVHLLPCAIPKLEKVLASGRKNRCGNHLRWPVRRGHDQLHPAPRRTSAATNLINSLKGPGGTTRSTTVISA